MFRGVERRRQPPPTLGHMEQFPDLAAMREEYGMAGLDVADCAADPFDQFARWFAEAAVLPEPSAMVVATADATGTPSVRTVLLKGVAAGGFTFFTNTTSAKGRDLAVRPAVALLFPWHPLERQVRVSGAAHRLPDDEVAAYFATRPRGSQLGAWASHQSTPVADRAELEAAHAAAQQRFPDEVPVPPHWGGYRVVPESFEFWQGRPGRMHDRITYTRRPDESWQLGRLAP